ncbi:uncharacterized protein MELLADRAFT_109445 [Melampsora larici-populina 98AG31]|uniref:Secreted protein n=1 Tax=Melampsora larici-populina (strain 98AG31 / pathotype 3-4-7) TaxID=747676 RepID=F4RWH7_MELLP|nr:uncharacterized protein MELLADRAFT_109445 [Melampsora larici-populina 98AG31]EGG03286.1 hypothetical protein MELLADRAFT_109445 [Melampsora larici-populina 98AG31]
MQVRSSISALWNQATFFLLLLIGPCLALDKLWDSLTTFEELPELDKSFDNLEGHQTINNLNFQVFDFPIDLSTQGEDHGSSNPWQCLLDEWLVPGSVTPNGPLGIPEQSTKGIDIATHSPQAIPMTYPGTTNVQYPHVAHLESPPNSDKNVPNHVPNQSGSFSSTITTEPQGNHAIRTICDGPSEAPSVPVPLEDDLSLLIPPGHISESSSISPSKAIGSKEILGSPILVQPVLENSTKSNQKKTHGEMRISASKPKSRKRKKMNVIMSEEHDIEPNKTNKRIKIGKQSQEKSSKMLEEGSKINRSHSDSSKSSVVTSGKIETVPLPSTNTNPNPKVTTTINPRLMDLYEFESHLFVQNKRFSSILKSIGFKVTSRNTFPFCLSYGKQLVLQNHHIIGDMSQFWNQIESKMLPILKTFFQDRRCAWVSLASWRAQHCIFPLFIHKVTDLEDFFRRLNFWWPFDTKEDTLRSSVSYFKNWITEELSEFIKAITESIKGKDPNHLYGTRNTLLTEEQSHVIFELEFSSSPDAWRGLSWKLLRGWIDQLGPEMRALFEGSVSLNNLKKLYVRKAAVNFSLYDTARNHKKLWDSFTQEYNFPKTTVDVRRTWNNNDWSHIEI